ncbi:MAG: transporter, partial [Eudoraea sp.]
NQGASSVVNNQFNDDQRANFVTAASIGASFSGNQGVKLAYIFSDTQNDIGSTTNTLLLTWSILFK